MDSTDQPATARRLAVTVRELTAEHQQVDDLLTAQLDRVIAGDFAAALVCFDAFAQRLREHLVREETLLFPALAMLPAPRWNVSVYGAEHDRLRLLLDKQRGRLADAAQTPVTTPKARRARSLALLDAAHPLRHVLQHHQQREADALFIELIDPTERGTAPDELWREPRGIRPA